MRTIRIKLYKFNELSKEAQEIACKSEVIRFCRAFNEHPTYNINTCSQAIERIKKFDYEFTKDGKRF